MVAEVSKVRETAQYYLILGLDVFFGFWLGLGLMNILSWNLVPMFKIVLFSTEFSYEALPGSLVLFSLFWLFLMASSTNQWRGIPITGFAYGVWELMPKFVLNYHTGPDLLFILLVALGLWYAKPKRKELTKLILGLIGVFIFLELWQMGIGIVNHWYPDLMLPYTVLLLGLIGWTFTHNQTEIPK